MKCILCAKEIREENAKWINSSSALCPECAALASKAEEQSNYENENFQNEKNKTGAMIQSVAIIIWAFGAIISFIVFAVSGVASIIVLVSYLFAVFVSGLLMYGLGEIIILLGQIKDKISTKR